MEKEILEKAQECLNCKTKPCQSGCPLENDIPAFIQKVKEEKLEEAYRILSKTTVLQSVCGRICPQENQCEGNCIRRFKFVPTKIGELETYVGDWAIKNNISYDEEPIVSNNKKIAIVGGGPAGLTCAAFLARKGYKVTIYERHEQLGGILRYGIPEFRLDKETLDKTIEHILALGIEKKCGRTLGRDTILRDLIEQYDAVFLSFGANISSKMGIPGEGISGIYGGNELLESGKHPKYKGKDVAIIGGGNVAMDCARTIKRLGAKSVKVIYRRAEKQMPATRKEIEEAKEEGIEFLFQTNIVRAIGETDFNIDDIQIKTSGLVRIECIKTELVKKEGEDREVPVDIEGSNFEIPMDYMIMAIGGNPDKNVIEHIKNTGIECNTRGYIQVNENYQTTNPKIFAGGDIIGGKATVAWAARAGRNAAEAIDKLISKNKNTIYDEEDIK